MFGLSLSVPFRINVQLFVVFLILAFSMVFSFFEGSVMKSRALSLSAPVNPAASEGASNLLQYLYSISGTKMISGQHDYLESPDEWNGKVKTITGKYAGIHGYELGAIKNQNEKTLAAEREAVVDSAIQWFKTGGIVTISYHANLPGTCLCWSNVQRNLSQSDFDKFVTPGTKQYKQLIADLDKTAVYLMKLRDIGVPVLWRPYHEMNGGWFWWGKKNNFSALWKIMYERFVNYHKLNNLLWVWSPNAPNASADPYDLTFPGYDKVDVLAADIYNSDDDVKYYTALLELAKGKPIAIGENGELPDPAVLEQEQKKWVYMMTWGKMLKDSNTEQTIKAFYKSDVVLTRDELSIQSVIQPALSPPIMTKIIGVPQ